MESDPVRCVQDEELRCKLRRRHFISEGERNVHCFVRPGDRRSDADQEEDEAEQGARNLDNVARDRGCADVEMLAHVVVDREEESQQVEGAVTPPVAEIALEASASLLQPPRCSPNGCCAKSPLAATKDLNSEQHTHDFFDTPRTPGSGNDTDSGDEDEDDNHVYELQFDILNSLPREKATLLVAHLRAQARKCTKAIKDAERLHHVNQMLQLRLEGVDGKHESHLATCAEGRTGGHLGAASSEAGQRHFFCFVGLLMAAFAFSLALGLGVIVALGPEPTELLHQGCPMLQAESRPVSLQSVSIAQATRDTGSEQELVALPVTTVDDAAAAGPKVEAAAACTVGTAGRIENQVLSLHTDSSIPDLGDIGVRESIVRDVTLPETASSKRDAMDIKKLKEEHQAMLHQLERLWYDIELAHQNGHASVCWQI